MKKITKISPGRKFVYIADVVGSPENSQKIVNMARNADVLYIEAAFMDQDLNVARKKYHLTAKEAGRLARKAVAGPGSILVRTGVAGGARFGTASCVAVSRGPEGRGRQGMDCPAVGRYG